MIHMRSAARCSVKRVECAIMIKAALADAEAMRENAGKEDRNMKMNKKKGIISLILMAVVIIFWDLRQR